MKINNHRIYSIMIGKHISQYRHLCVLLVFLFLFPFAYGQADFKITSDVGCTDFNVGFSVQGIVPDNVSWDFGDGNTSNGIATFNLYIKAGVFEVTMTAFKDGVPHVVKKNITVHKSPVSDFTFDNTKGCPPLTVNFLDNSKKGSSEIVKRTWGFSNGVVIEGNDKKLSQIFTSPGYKDISLIVEDENGCKSTKSVNNAVYIHPQPKVSFEFSNSNACDIPVLANFVNKSDSLNAYSFLWDFGDGETSTDISPSHLFKKEGDFLIKLTATDANGCSNSYSLSNMIVDENFNVNIDITDTLGCDSLNTPFKPIISSLYRKLTWTIDPDLEADMKKMKLKGKKPGVYNVKLEAVSQFGCTISATRKVYIDKQPIVDFTADKLLDCKVPTEVKFQNKTQNGYSYEWRYGGGGSSTAENPTRVYTQKGEQNVMLIAKSEHGCESSVLRQRYISIINPQVEINGEVSGCAPFNTKLSVTPTNGFNISNVQWDFGNGTTFNGVNPPNVTYATEGDYTVKAKVSFAEGCEDLIVTKKILVGSSKMINATISANEICPSQSLTGQVNPIPNAKYQWSIGNIENINTRTFSYKFGQTGTFQVYVEVLHNGCKTIKKVGDVTVKPTAANFRVLNNCSKGVVVFRNENNAGVESTWDFGDGTKKIDNSKDVKHQYTSYGTYQVQLTVHNKATGCKDVFTKTIEVKKSATEGYQLKPIKGCAPLEISYDAVPGGKSNHWILGGDTILNENPLELTMEEAGRYDVVLMTSIDGCRDTLIYKDLIEVIKPEAGFKFSPIGGCAPVISTFQDTSKSLLSTIEHYTWDLGGLETKKDIKTFTSTFDIEAILPITLYVEDNFGCKDSVTNDLIVARPFAEFNLPTASFCTGNAFAPENLSTGVGLKYFWDFGDGTPIDTSRSPEHFYVNEGVYDIELKVVDDNNCESIKKIENAVTIQDINYDFIASPTSKYCPELLTSFSIIPQNITYRRTVWDFGDGSVVDDTTRNPKYIYIVAGEYDVTLELEDFRGCKEVIKKEKFIDLTGPSGKFDVKLLSNCTPAEIEITADIKNSVANFWNYDDGTVIYDPDPTPKARHTYTEPGVYQPSVTVDDGLGCIATIYGPEIVIGGPEPVIDKTFDVACSNEDVEFVDMSISQAYAPIINRKWTFSDGFTTSDSTFSRNIDVVDSLEVYINLQLEDSLGCVNSVQDTLFVFKNAPLEVVPELIICKGDSIQLSAKRVRYYEWSPSGSLNETNIGNPTAYPLQDTEYEVRGFVSPTCYTDKKVRVEVREAFAGSVSNDTLVCLGDSAKLWIEHDLINSGKFQYKWSLDGTVVSDSKEFFVSPEQTATYLVHIQNGACRDFNSSVTVEVSDYPTLSIEGDAVILPGYETKLDAISEPGVTFKWEPEPDRGCKNCPFAFVSPTQSTVYTVTVTNQYGCSVKEDITVDVVEGCDGNAIEIQNVFTPNNDGVNDFFTLRNNQLITLEKVRIYSRTGELIYQSSNIKDAWDGTYNGELLNTGVYVYYIEAQCKNGTPILLKGNITLLR